MGRNAVLQDKGHEILEQLPIFVYEGQPLTLKDWSKSMRVSINTLKKKIKEIGYEIHVVVVISKIKGD